VQRHRQAVDLELGGVDDLLLSHDAEDPLLELPELVLAVGVVEAEHRDPVGEGGELVRRGLPHPLGGAVGGHEVREAPFQVPELALQRVVLPIGDLGAAEDVVEVLVPADLFPKLSNPLLGGRAGAQGNRRARTLSDRGRG
jgi:hypothetical protein